jgi:hypothetical protein
MSSLVSESARRVGQGGGNLAGQDADGVGANNAPLGLHRPGAVHAALVVDTVEDNVGADILDTVGGSSSLQARAQTQTT